MALFELTKDNLIPAAETQFHREGIYERTDLQRLLRQDVAVLAPDLMVLAQEFGNWEDSNRRIDLLCLNKDAQLVIGRNQTHRGRWAHGAAGYSLRSHGIGHDVR